MDLRPIEGAPPFQRVLPESASIGSVEPRVVPWKVGGVTNVVWNGMDASMSHFDILHSFDIQQHPILLLQDDILCDWTDLGNADFPHLCASFEHSSPLLSSFSFPSVFSFEQIINDDGSLSNEDLLSYAAFKGFNIVIKDNGKIRLYTSEFHIQHKLYVEPADYKVNAWSFTKFKFKKDIPNTAYHITPCRCRQSYRNGEKKYVCCSSCNAFMHVDCVSFPVLGKKRKFKCSFCAVNSKYV